MILAFIIFFLSLIPLIVFGQTKVGDTIAPNGTYPASSSAYHLGGWHAGTNKTALAAYLTEDGVAYFDTLTSNLWTYTTADGWALLGTITYDAAFTNAAETVHESYDGVQVITSAAAIALTPTKSFMELTLTNAPTITAAAAMRRTSHMLTIFGTNTVTMGAQFTLVGSWTQAATNYMTLFPSGQSTNWIYGVRTP